MADGRIIIDTEIDNSGLEKGMEKAKQSAKSQASKLAAEYKKQGMSASEAFKKAWSEIERDSNDKAEKTAKNWEKSTNKISSAAKEGLKGLGSAIVATSAALVAAGTVAVKVGMDFESQMSRVKAISGATNDEFKKLNDLAIELGASTSFSAKEAAQGMENLASAGFSTNEIMAAMPGMLDLAASSGEDLASSADIAASTLRGFGLDASYAGHVADVLAKNASDTNAAVADTGEAMKYIAPVAHSMGLSLEEVTAAIGIMADAGIKGSQSGTTLRSALSRLAAPSKESAELISSLGFNAYDSSGKMLPLNEMITNLKGSMEGLTEQEKQAAIVTIFGQESLSGMLTLMEAGPDKINKLTESFKNSDGAAANMAKTMKDNLKGSVDEFGGALESLQIKLYQSVDNPIKDVVQSATGMIDDLSNAFSTGGFEGLIQELGTVFSSIITGIATNAPAIVNAAVTMISSLVTGLQQNLPAISQGAISIINTLVNGFITLLPQILSLGLQLLIQLGQGIAQSLPTLLPTLISTVVGICDMIISNIGTIVSVGIQILVALIQGLVQALPTLISEIPRIINAFSSAIYAQLPQILMAGIQILLILIQGLIQAIPTLIANIPQIIMAIVNVVTLYNWASLGTSLITKLGEGITAMKGNIGNIAKGVAEWVGTTITNIFRGGLSWGSGLISSIGQGFSSMVGYLGSSASSVASSALNVIKSLFSGGASIGSNLIQGIWNGISNMKQWILDKIGGFAGSIISGIKDFFDINSPSRVMRDLIGVNLVKGIGVGIDVETPNLERDINTNLSDLTAKMQATVNYETSRTTAGVVSKSNRITSSDTSDTTHLDKLAGALNNLSKRPIQTSVNVSGREIAEATSEHSDKISGQRLSLAQRGVIV